MWVDYIVGQDAPCHTCRKTMESAEKRMERIEHRRHEIEDGREKKKKQGAERCETKEQQLLTLGNQGERVREKENAT